MIILIMITKWMIILMANINKILLLNEEMIVILMLKTINIINEDWNILLMTNEWLMCEVNEFNINDIN